MRLLLFLPTTEEEEPGPPSATAKLRQEKRLATHATLGSGRVQPLQRTRMFGTEPQIQLPEFSELKSSDLGSGDELPGDSITQGREINTVPFPPSPIKSYT